MKKVVVDLCSKVSTIIEGGGIKAIQRHTSKGKLLPRERIQCLLDNDSAFLEMVYKFLYACKVCYAVEFNNLVWF